MSYGTGGCTRPYIGGFLHGSGAGSTTLQIEYVSDVSTHRGYAGRLSPLGDIPTDRDAEKTVGVRELVPPTFW